MTVSISGTGGVTFPDNSVQATAATGFGFKNRLINGAMVIDQRNAGASVTPTNGGYSLDRWGTFINPAGKYTVQQNAGSVTPPAGYTNYLGVTSTSAYAITSTDYMFFQQAIEGFNTADLAWGTASAAIVTLSFLARSSLTGTFGGVLYNSAGNRSYPFTYSIPAANTWTSISVTVAGDTTGTWLTTNGAGINVAFGLGVGSAKSGPAGSWASANYYSATGATSVVGTSGATFYITGVQLEKGSTATAFDYRPYGTELALCQRYYEVGTDRNAVMWAGNTTNAINYFTNKGFCVAKRASPTVTTSNEVISGFGSGAPSLNNDITGFQANKLANSATSGGYFFYNWTASAEL